MSSLPIKFSFGENWSRYVKNYLDEVKISAAKDSLLKYLPPKKYENKVFIDVGCGSGIFSLGALRLGCREVISFDVDEYSVAAAETVKKRFSSLAPRSAQWEIFKGSILDGALVDKLKNRGDIVYAWGVLHHTGDMWQAIKNATRLVNANGYLILAIYNRAPSSGFWLKVKKSYNLAPSIIKKLMVYSIYMYIILRKFEGHLKSKILNPKNLRSLPLKRERGMSDFYDLIDWLGGYPYEFAAFDEIKSFVENLRFQLVKAPIQIPSPRGSILDRFSFAYIGNNEFIFRKNETY